MELIPIIYLFLCYLVAISFGNTRRIGFWGSFILALFITPLLALLIMVWLPARQKAYCMRSYKDFEVGRGYYFRKTINRNAQRIYVVYNATTCRVTEETFNNHFSILIDNSKKTFLAPFLKVFK